MAITKTYSYSVAGVTMADFDAAVAEAFGYDPVVNVGETKSQFGRRNVRQLIYERYMAGTVNPVVESAEEAAFNNLGTIT